MGMVVQHNMTAANANRMLGVTTGAQAKSTEKLSSGYKINRAADDAAGLTISEKMRSQVRGLTQASANAEDGISCVQTAEGALNEVHSMLQRMNELAVKGANGTNTTADRDAIASEVSALYQEIDRVKTTTNFNTLSLLDGTFSGGIKLQVGAAGTTQNTIAIDIKTLSTSGIGLGANASGLAITLTAMDNENSTGDYKGIKSMLSNSAMSCASQQANWQSFIKNVTMAIASISKQRSDLGAIQNRLEHTIANLDNVVENTQAAESAIRDTDMASEMVTYSKNNILAQAGQSMLAQANQSNQGVLSLLG